MANDVESVEAATAPQDIVLECAVGPSKRDAVKTFEVTLAGAGTEGVGMVTVRALCAADAIVATLAHFGLNSETTAAFPNEV